MHHTFENVIQLLMIVYILCNQIIGLNSKSSILWKLNDKSGKIDSYSDSHQHLAKEIRDIYENDAVFSIITSSANSIKINNHWRKDVDSTCTASADFLHSYRAASNAHQLMHNVSQKRSDINLDCGRPVSFSFYDDLIGISLRYNHPLQPDLEAATLFLKSNKNLKAFDINVLEKRLKKAKHDKPWNAKLFHKIGNFWRIKGDAGKAIDCFRSALIMDPTNADILHDLARILFNLQYLDDAIFLARRSLEARSNSQHAWRSFFTLGEIYRAYGQFQQSILYFRQALELNPQHEPIRRAIQDMEQKTPSHIQFYTIVIICLLVIGVLGVIITTNDFTFAPDTVEPKSQRSHFNRAMAMKSLKGFVHRSKPRKV